MTESAPAAVTVPVSSPEEQRKNLSTAQLLIIFHTALAGWLWFRVYQALSAPVIAGIWYADHGWPVNLACALATTGVVIVILVLILLRTIQRYQLELAAALWIGVFILAGLFGCGK